VKDRVLRVALYSLDDPAFPCARLRVLDPAEASPDAVELRRGVHVGPKGISVDTELLEWCDVVLVQRGFPGRQAHESGVIDRILGAGKPIVYETDDDFASIPDWHGKPGYREDAGWILRFLPHASLVTVATPVLGERLAPHHRRVRVLPNCINATVWPVAAPVETGMRDPHILYAGSRGHWRDLQTLEAVLADVLDRHAAARVTIAGVERTVLAGHPRVGLLPFNGTYHQYPRRLAGVGASFAVVPLVDHPFNETRSPIKFLEYAAAGLPGVFQDAPAYAIVRDRVDGLKAGASLDAWRDAIELLIIDDDFRQALAEAANRRVRDAFLLSSHAYRWLEAWREAMG
jgi:glycosyltransferase involved in cell wall biosynthesis